MLVESLISALQQTAPPAEIIVVDDLGSPSTHDVVRECAMDTTTRVRYIDGSAAAKGTAGSSRNLGAREASNPWIAFLDDDDLWLPTFLERAREVAERLSTDVVIAWMDFLHDGVVTVGRRIPPNLVISQVLARNPGMTGSNALISREHFLKIGGFDESLWVANDKDLLVRMLAAGLTYGVVTEPVVLHRVHSNDRLTQNSTRREEGIIRYINKYEKQLSPSDRRYLMRQVYGIRSALAPTVGQRAAFKLLHLYSYAASWRPQR